MKLKYKLEFQQIGNNFMGVPYGENAPEMFLQLNEVGKDIVKMLEEETTRDGVVQSILKEYDVDENTATECLDELLEQLRDSNMLSE